jgi:hypothetical protein
LPGALTQGTPARFQRVAGVTREHDVQDQPLGALGAGPVLRALSRQARTRRGNGPVTLLTSDVSVR